jgi:hypothetical protein
MRPEMAGSVVPAMRFGVTREQIVAVLDFVTRSLRESEPAEVDSV